MFDRTFAKAARNAALLAVLVALFVMAGCSCKEYEEQIMQLDAQIAELQKDISDKDAIIAERDQIAEELRTNLKDCKGDNAALIEASEEVVMITIQRPAVLRLQPGHRAGHHGADARGHRPYRARPPGLGRLRRGLHRQPQDHRGVARDSIPPTGSWVPSAPPPWSVT